MGIDIDNKKLLKKIKKKLCCNGCVLEDNELGEIIQVQGNKKDELKALLIKEFKLKDENVKLHGT
jgi:translation initiation factor 1